ncbi:ribosome-dependent ATPase, partial [Klebsiella variicola]
SRCMKTSTSSPACLVTIKQSANCVSTSCCRAPGWRRFAIAPPENSPVG